MQIFCQFFYSIMVSKNYSIIHYYSSFLNIVNFFIQTIFSYTCMHQILHPSYSIYNIFLSHIKLQQFFMLFLVILLSIFNHIQSALNGAGSTKTASFNTTNNSIQAGIMDLSNINTTQNNYIYTYNQPFSGAMPRSALSITGMQVADPLYPYLGFKVNILNQMLYGMNISYISYNNTQFTSFKVSFFTAAAAQNYVYIDYQDIPTANLATGKNSRSDTFTFSNPGNTVNLKNKNYIMPFVTGLIMDKANSSNFQIAFTTYTKDTNNYDINLTTSEQTIIKSVSYFALLYDQTSIEETQTVYIDSNFMTTPGILNLIHSNSINFFSGINSFNFDHNLGMYFNFFMNNYSLQSYPTVKLLNYSTWNLRLRNCNTSFPYYLQSQQLCYKNCPEGYITNITYNFCQICYYSCATCITNLYNGCKTCNSNSRRILINGQCLCNVIGYYDGMKTTCQACSYECNSCSISSSNCTSCLSSNYRTLNSNSCPCDSGYFDNNSAVCVLCSNVYTNCLSCTNSGCLTCIKGYFVTNTNTCSICSQNCDQCNISSSNCTSCLSSNYRTLNSNSCPCDSGYFDNNSAVCVLCSNVYTNCLSCTNSGCLTCIQGYFVTNNNLCFSCSYSCFTCSIAQSNCTSCLSINFRLFDTNSCPCEQLYFDNNIPLCVLCSSVFLNCLSCTKNFCRNCIKGYYRNQNNSCQACSYECNSCSISSSNCTYCLSSNYRTLNSNSCPCDSGYFDNSSAVCVLCSNVYTNCETCTRFVCSNCVAGFYLNSASCQLCGSYCSECNVISTNCTACFSSTLQTLPTCDCLMGYYFNFAQSICILCSQYIRGCNQCSNFQTCITCKQTLTLSDSNNCVCKSYEFYNQITSKCNHCLIECLTCSDNSTCVTCDSNLYRILNNQSLCSCQLYYIQQNGICVPNFTCQSQCSTCKNPITCSSCKQLSNLQLINNNCTCNSSFTFNQNGKCVPIYINSTCNSYYYFFDNSTGFCEEICGDGILHILECDDNNNIDGDGCSKYCTIEEFYICQGKSPSHCSYNQSVNFSVTQTIKQLYSNTLDMRFMFEPFLKKFSTLDFSKAIIFNISDMNIVQYRKSGQKKEVVVIINYNTNLQNNYVNISLQSPNQNQTFALKSSNITYKISSNPQAINYTTQLYKKLMNIKQFLQGIVIADYFFVVFGFFVSKKTILQTICTMQLSILLLSFLKTSPFYFSSLNEISKIVNGYNGLFYDFPSVRNHNLLVANQRIKILGYACEFFTDINYMIIIELLLFLIYSISICLVDQNYITLRNISNYLIKQLLIGIQIFNSLNLGFCIGLQIMFNSEYLGFDMIPLIITICIRIVSGYFFVKKILQNNSIIQQIKKSRLQQIFPIVICYYRLIFGLIIGLSNNYPYVLFLLIILQAIFMVFMVYLKFKRQYQPRFISLLSILNQFLMVVLMLVIIIICYTQYQLESRQLSLFAIYMLCIVSSGLIGFIFFLIYAFKIYKRRKSQAQENRIIYPQNKLSSEARNLNLQFKANDKIQIFDVQESSSKNEINQFDSSVEIFPSKSKITASKFKPTKQNKS